jgi:cysteine desulfurase/selenocysteine lyase
MLNPIHKARLDFPALNGASHDYPFTYLDSAASALKPQSVIQSMADFYAHDYANIHRGLYDLSAKASKHYEAVREAAAKFIHARSSKEIIFVRNGTEGFNLLASCLSKNIIKAGSQIIVTEMEHHANLVPWQVVAKDCGAQIVSIPLLPSGDLDILAYQHLLKNKTSLVCFTAVSNVLGCLNPIKKIIEMAHGAGALTVVDAAQMAPHMGIDVQDLDCDFLSLSGHKCYGPSGASFLYGQLHLLESMPPYQTGGGMIEEVFIDHSSYAPVPQKFEAGTPAIAEVVGLGEAIHYIQSYGLDQIELYEQTLLNNLLRQLQSRSYITILGEPEYRMGLVAFTLQDIHPHDVASLLNEENIAVRAGHHCAMPLHRALKVPASVRASLGIYNDANDIDRLMIGLDKVAQLFGVI